MRYPIVFFVAALCGISSAHAVTVHGGTEPVPSNDPGSWVLSNDYPSKELREEVTGVTSFKLTIDASGQIMTCEITESSGSANLDSTTCALVRARARFESAKDSRGRPIAGEYSNRVRWTIPDPSPLTIPEGKLHVVLSVDLDKDGVIENCDHSITGEEFAEGAISTLLCSEFPVGEKMGRVVDASGKPIGARITMTQTVEFTPR